MIFRTELLNRLLDGYNVLIGSSGVCDECANASAFRTERHG